MPHKNKPFDAQKGRQLDPPLNRIERGELISRTILDEWGNPIGTITLFDVQEKAGFLGTWLGKPYHGKGYNKLAKDSFFSELFY
ncbi:hypothetical protein ACT453_54415, partial [Bacillus sp. D-CC]